jgi:hypothetical protein
MSNLFLPSSYDESLHRLALGIEPIDAARGRRLRHPLYITFDEVPRGLPRPRVVRHGSGLAVLLHGDDVPATFALRLFDHGEPHDPALFRAETNQRRFVPRRLRITIPGAAVAAADPTGLTLAERIRHRTRSRACRPGLFPGVGYDVSDAVTGLRGRIVSSDGQPVPWTRLLARRVGDPSTAPPVAVAHGDDRGEFLLLVEPGAASMSTLDRTLALTLTVHVPPLPTPLPTPAVQAVDPLWRLPVDTLDLTTPFGTATAWGVNEQLEAGRVPPSTWTVVALAQPAPIEFEYGRLVSRGDLRLVPV